MRAALTAPGRRAEAIRWLLALLAVGVPLLLGQQTTASITQDLGRPGDLFNVTGSGVLPPVGVSAGSRARGADVLTLRFLAGQGIRLASDAVGPPGVAAPIPLESALTFSSANNIALMTDCADTDVFRVAGGGTTLIPAGNANDGTIGRYLRREDTRVFDFERDFRAITYYLRLVADPNPDAPAGRLISSLARRQNGVDQIYAVVRIAA